MDWHIRFSFTSHYDAFLRPGGLVGTVGVLGAASLAVLCNVHGGVALVAAGLPILAGDFLLGAHGLDIGQGLVHRGVHWSAFTLGHLLADNHQVAVLELLLEELPESVCCLQNLEAADSLPREGWTHTSSSTRTSNGNATRDFRAMMTSLPWRNLNEERGKGGKASP